MHTGSDRGQAYTLEAFIAAVLLISSLAFALQITAVTPLSASTSNQHIENQHQAAAAGTLVAADRQNALKPGVLYWNHSADVFHDPDRIDYYTGTYPNNDFGDILNRSFAGKSLAINVVIHHEGSGQAQRMLYNGEPSDNAASATRTVTIFDGDWVRHANGTRDEQVQDVSFYAADQHPNSIVYNVVRVEVIVWRM